MAVLLLADHENGNLSEATARALTAAYQIDAQVDILVAGKDIAAITAYAAQLKGVRKIISADHSAFEYGLAEPISALILSFAHDYDGFLAPATISGKNIMPRIAALLDVMQISEIIEVIDAQTFKRPIYAGNAVQVIQSDEAKKVITIRISAFAPTPIQDAVCPIVTTSFIPQNNLTRFIENKLSVNERPELGSARIVISGGRALGSAENFNHYILPLADKLGAAIGASRAAVDAGYAPNDWQVGQTGKIVAPDIYIACGISGAIQHLAGMKDSKIIVAINIDGDAPIFQNCDYGLVADLFEVLPSLYEKLDE